MFIFPQPPLRHCQTVEQHDMQWIGSFLALLDHLHSFPWALVHIHLRPYHFSVFIISNIPFSSTTHSPRLHTAVFTCKLQNLHINNTACYIMPCMTWIKLQIIFFTSFAHAQNTLMTSCWIITGPFLLRLSLAFFKTIFLKSIITVSTSVTFSDFCAVGSLTYSSKSF